jgi:hypothetical protein
VRYTELPQYRDPTGKCELQGTASIEAPYQESVNYTELSQNTEHKRKSFTLNCLKKGNLTKTVSYMELHQDMDHARKMLN